MIIAIALLLATIGFLWLVVVGFKRSVLWGILVFLFSPLSAIVFSFMNWYEAKYAFLLHIISLTVFFWASYVLVVDEIGIERIVKIQAAVESGQIKENETFLYLDPNTLLPGEEDDSEEAEAGIDLDGDGIIDTPESVITGDEKNLDAKGGLADAGGARVTEPKVATDSVEIAKLSESHEDEELEVIIEEENPPLSYPTPGSVMSDPLVNIKKKEQIGSVRVKLSKMNNYIGRYFIITTKKGNEHRGILIKVTKSRIILERKIYGGTFKYKISKKRVKQLKMLKKEYIDEHN